MWAGPSAISPFGLERFFAASGVVMVVFGVGDQDVSRFFEQDQ